MHKAKCAALHCLPKCETILRVLILFGGIGCTEFLMTCIVSEVTGHSLRREEEVMNKAEIQNEVDSFCDEWELDVKCALSKHLTSHLDYTYKVLLFVLAGTGATMGMLLTNLDSTYKHISHFVICFALILLSMSAIIGFIGIVLYVAAKIFYDSNADSEFFDKYKIKISKIQKHIDELPGFEPEVKGFLGYLIKRKVLSRPFKIDGVEFPVNRGVAIFSLVFHSAFILQLLFFVLFWLTLIIGIIF